MKTIILAGGSGTRLWPLSREYFPKQFIRFNELGNKSLFQKAFERALKTSSAEDIIVVTGEKHKFLVIRDIEELGIKSNPSNILCEPVGRNTLPAIAWAMSKLDADESALILSADQLILDEENLIKDVPLAQKLSQETLVLFGCKPLFAHTGYGYIKYEGNSILEYKEKPEKGTAEKYVSDGSYLWNLGMFLFKKSVFDEELAKHAPEIKEFFEKEGGAYETLPSVSVDYGLSEKTQRLSVVPLSINWSDLGSFEALYDVFEKDEESNVRSGNVISKRAEGNFVHSTDKDRLISINDVDNLIVVDTKDALLICSKGTSQKVKEVVNDLKTEEDPRIDFHQTVYRPWGSFTVLEDTPGHKVKRLTVLPGKLLSLQSHNHRSEHWTVISGTAYVVNGDDELFVEPNHSVYIPKGNKHRLGNKGDKIVEVIEVQCGDYFGEDDIIRYEDEYDRA